MNKEEFKKAISELDIPWVCNDSISNIWCPIYHKPKYGYVGYSPTIMSYDDLYNEIVEHNKNTIIKDNAVIYNGFELKKLN